MAHPDRPSAGPSWGECYALRFWIELGFQALKSLSWQWQKTRRTAPARISRHLVRAVSGDYAHSGLWDQGRRHVWPEDAPGRLPSPSRALAPTHRSSPNWRSPAMPLHENPIHTPVSGPPWSAT